MAVISFGSQVVVCQVQWSTDEFNLETAGTSAHLVLPVWVSQCHSYFSNTQSGCLTLLEILEIYWNNFSLLEIYWKLAKSPGKFLADSKFLYFTVYQ